MAILLPSFIMLTTCLHFSPVLKRFALTGFFCLCGWIATPLWALEKKPEAAQNKPAKPSIALEVEIKGISGPLLDNARAYLSLEQQKNLDTLSAIRIKRLFKSAPKELSRALQTFGFYHAQIQTELREPDGQNKTWQAIFTVKPGKPVTLQIVEINLSGAGKDDAAFQQLLQQQAPKIGEVFRHKPYDLLKKNLQDLAEERGYFDANFTQHRVLVHKPSYQVDLFLHMETGARYRFGKVKFLQDYFQPALLEALIPFKPEEFYSTEKFLKFRSALGGSDYFQDIKLQSQRDRENQVVNIAVKLKRRNRRSYRVRMGYGTDTGVRVLLDMNYRYLNHYGHRFVPSLGWSFNRQRQIANLSYIIPLGDYRTDYVQTTLAYKGEDFYSSDMPFNGTETLDGRTRVVDSSITLAKYHPRHVAGLSLTEILSLTYLEEKYNLMPLLFSAATQEVLEELEGTDIGSLSPLRPHFKVLYAGLNWRYTQADQRLRASKGQQLELRLKAARKGWGSNVSFTQAWLKGRMIRRLAPRSRLLLRGDIAYTQVDTLDILGTFNANDLPKELQFRTGGDYSVRGYKYEEINGGDETLGSGKHMLVGSIEYEYRFLEQWSAAAFVDMGNVFNRFNKMQLKTGIGTGIRWQSPVGPVRLDIAYGLSKTSSPWRLHLNIGPDF